MPNGGSDCCGTCWFNSKNDGEPGYQDPESKGLAKCTIRELEIPDPFWTYCVNHPHCNPDKIQLPLGPVYISDGYPYTRKVWIHAPDNEFTRTKLLEVLRSISSSAKVFDQSEAYFAEEVLKQVRAFKDERSLPMLLDITRIHVDGSGDKEPERTRNITVLIGHSIEALLEISKGEYLDQVERFIDCGLSEDSDAEKDVLAAIRYHLVRGLQYCTQDRAIELLQEATNDPHAEVKAFAAEILKKRNQG